MDVVIFGAGGLGREIQDTIQTLGDTSTKFNLLGYVDDYRNPQSVVNGVPVLGGTAALDILPDEVGIVLGMADPKTRRKIHQTYRHRFTFPNVFHPRAVISRFAEIGQGVLIQANCIVASNATLGNCVMINAGSGVGHDARIGDYCSIMSQCDLAGNTRLGDLCFVGTGARVVDSTQIAEGSYLCAGAVVLKDVTQKAKLLGNPAKTIA